MNDVEYVKQVLSGDFKPSKDKEVPYPSLDSLKAQIEFEYHIGKVLGEVPNGSVSREGKPYLWFKHDDKRILTHRFIVAVTLGKWPPRQLHVDHINNDPSDNRPENLRVVTPRDNAGNRRRTTLPELADINKRDSELKAETSKREEARRRLAESSEAHISVTPEPISDSSTIRAFSKLRTEHSFERSRVLPPNHPVFTGETKPAIPSGVWHRTTIETWWWRRD